MSSSTEYKVRENAARRMAQRQGFTVQKSFRRDPRAVEYGTYMIVKDGSIVAAGDTHRGFGMSLDEVEQWLRS